MKPDFSRAWELNEKVVEKVFFTNDPSRRMQEYHVPEFENVEEILNSVLMHTSWARLWLMWMARATRTQMR